MASATASGMRCSLAGAAPGACGAAISLTQSRFCPKSVDHLRLYVTVKMAIRKRQYSVLTPLVFLNSTLSLQYSHYSSAGVSLIANAHQNLNSALVDTEKKENREIVEEPPGPMNTTGIPRKFRMDAKTGAFQHLPMVSPAYEVLGSAIRKAKMVRPTKGINNVAKRERNRGAKQLDALMKELALPLRTYVQSFPRRQQLHAYESALVELTLGRGEYEQVLERVDFLRKRIVDLGKNYASLCAKTTTKREAEERLTEGFTRLEELFKKQGSAVDDLMEQAKKLRAVPVISLRTPTLCLVGAPNVGKSSLVRILSSGKPEVCNYQFTTRGISLGHFEIESRRFQVTDTPGLLERPDEERNNMEKLTLAALSHLPTSILYVHDLTGECGTSAATQFNIYTEMKKRYFDRPWLDVVSKADLLPAVSPSPSSSNTDPIDSYRQIGPSSALRVSVETGEGVDELVQRVHDLLVQAHPDESKDEENTRLNSQPDPGYIESVQEFYYPAWPRKQES